MSSPAMTTDLLENKDLIEKFLQKQPSRLSAYSFLSIFAWRDFFDFNLEVIDDHLCVFARHELGVFLYLPPLGDELSLKTINRCFDSMEAQNKRKGITRIENVTFEQLAKFPQGPFKSYPKSYEYCYFKKDLAGLKGNLYKSQRASVNQFVRSHSFEYLPYGPDMKDDCLKLYSAWAQEKAQNNADPVYQEMLRDNHKVQQLILDHFQELAMTGRVVKIHGRMAAYTFGFELSPDMFCVYSEIADVAYKGLPAFIFHSFCNDQALRSYAFMNCMDDFELPNIQRTKMAYCPSVLLPSYVVTKI